MIELILRIFQDLRAPLLCLGVLAILLAILGNIESKWFKTVLNASQRLLLVLLGVVLLGLLVLFAPPKPQPPPPVPIGTVVASLLPPPKFDEVAGPGWLPADGRSVQARSTYARTSGRAILPDLRGMFLRGLNTFEDGRTREDGNQDPDAGRVVQSFQADMFAEHKHPYPKANTVADGEVGIVTTNYANKTLQGSPAGGAETRPKNVAVYWYIRVE